MKKIMITLLCLVFLFGCGARKTADGYDMPQADYYSMGGDYAVEEDSSYSVSQHKTQANVANAEEKLVYRSSIVLETKDYSSLTKELEEIMKQYEAITQSMRESGGSGRTFRLTIRVPARHFDEFIQSLRDSSGSIIDISTNVDNITRQYDNNEIRIEALETQHTRLLQLLNEAKDLNDIIQIEARLSEVETEITQLKSYKNSMDADVAYSTIDLTIREVQTYSETSFLQKLLNAFSGSRSNFLRNAEDLIIWFIYRIPQIVILVIAFFLLRKPVTNLIGKINKKEKKSVMITEQNNNNG